MPCSFLPSTICLIFYGQKSSYPPWGYSGHEYEHKNHVNRFYNSSAPVGAKGSEKMKDSYEQRIQNQFGAFCVKVLKNEAGYIQREYTRLRDQEKSLGELTASELEQTAVWDKHFMDEHVFDVQGLPVVVTGDLLADTLAQLPEGKRDVILLSYFLGMFSLSESYSVCST